VITGKSENCRPPETAIREDSSTKAKGNEATRGKGQGSQAWPTKKAK
jgi:hypothetical protein